MAKKTAASENTIQIHFPAQPDVGIMFAQTVEVPDTGDFVHDKHVAAQKVKGIKDDAVTELDPATIEANQQEALDTATGDQVEPVADAEQIADAQEQAGEAEATAVDTNTESEDKE
jgi:hypothetical protein